jgi:phosphatidylglycerol:prolipoprotein diacylglycerol transferase
MHPVLFSWGSISIFSYGLLIAAGFLIGVALARREASRVGIDPERMTDLGFYIVVAALVGSRLLYVLTNPSHYLAHPLEILMIWKGGLVFYGGFLGALATALVYVRRKGLPVWGTADVIAPSIAFGQFLGRLGCFFAGCCYGKACELPWAVTFRHPETLAPAGVPLHPTQLYSAAGNLMIFFFLMLLRKRKKWDGQVFWTYVFLYAVIRSIVEIFRGDFRGPEIGLLSVSQTIACFLALAAFLIIVRKRWGGKGGNTD